MRSFLSESITIPVAFKASRYHAQVRIDGILRSMYAEGLNYESGAAEVEQKARKQYPNSEVQLVTIEMLPKDAPQYEI